MNSLYHRVAVVSVGIALGFALGANKEARAATFTFTSTRSVYIIDKNQDGVVDNGSDYPGPRYVGINYKEGSPPWEKGEYRSFYEFNITNLSLDSNTLIKSAYFQTRVNGIQYGDKDGLLDVYGYTEEVFQFDNNGKYLDTEGLGSLGQNQIATFNVLPLINQTIENNDSFWLSLRTNNSFVTLPWQSSLTITTEPVPEPTTIFGSALALGVGGWLKRKKLSQQNKTTSQH
jgi:hypothetical protein